MTNLAILNDLNDSDRHFIYAPASNKRLLKHASKLGIVGSINKKGSKVCLHGNFKLDELERIIQEMQDIKSFKVIGSKEK